MGDVEYGKCQYCKTDRPLYRTYFDFPIACECCGPTHHEMVKHCGNCKPKMPVTTTIYVSTKKLLDPIHEGLFKKR